jgi:hypothetical protein
MSLDVASLGVQVHGGMGFIEETGAAQHLRDAKILTIYEGTTAIQANDLVGRKTARDGGQRRQGHRAQIELTEAELKARTSPACRRWPSASKPAARPSSTRWTSSPARPRPAPTPLCRQRALPDAGRHRGGRLADGACAAGRRGPPGRRRRGRLHAAKIATCRFYADHILTKAPGLRDSIVDGADAVTALALESF